MAGETGGTGGTFPPGPINSISWVGPGGPIYNENGPFLLLLDCFSAIAIVVGIGGFGPLETLGDPFPWGPLMPSPPTSGIISPALYSIYSIIQYYTVSYSIKNICYCLKKRECMIELSLRHKEIEFRADHGNVKFTQTRPDSKRSKPSTTRTQPKSAEQSSLLTRKFTRSYHKFPT